MTEDQNLLDTLFGIGQLFSVLLLLFGAYLSTPKPVFAARRSEEEQKKHERA